MNVKILINAFDADISEQLLIQDSFYGVAVGDVVVAANVVVVRVECISFVFIFELTFVCSCQEKKLCFVSLREEVRR